MTHWLSGVQTTDVAPGGAAASTPASTRPALWLRQPPVANVDKGEIGAIEVGDVHGTMTH